VRGPFLFGDQSHEGGDGLYDVVSCRAPHLVAVAAASELRVAFAAGGDNERGCEKRLRACADPGHAAPFVKNGLDSRVEYDTHAEPRELFRERRDDIGSAVRNGKHGFTVGRMRLHPALVEERPKALSVEGAEGGADMGAVVWKAGYKILQGARVGEIAARIAGEKKLCAEL